MPEDTKPNAPIEIVIKLDPTAAGRAIKRGARETRRLATSNIAVRCYWIAAAGVVLAVLLSLASEGIISGKVLAPPVMIALVTGAIALKRRYSPLIRD